MLKYRADLRTLGYIIITTALFAYQWKYGTNWWLYTTFLFFEVAVSVITHNHNHLSIWNWQPLNILTDWWLTIFYGAPVFAWIPTHNRNHHRFVNTDGDTSLTYRKSEENNLLTVLSYPSMSGFYQVTQSVIPYMKDLRVKDRAKFIENWVQIFVLVIWVATFLILDWKRALFLVVLPQQVSAFSVFVFNYLQHVHADEESKYNHSRNFMGVNWFLFNNGFHTMHHERASIHWSELPQAHKKIEHLIAPHLIEPSFWWYIFRTYLLSIFVPKYRSNSMRLERMKTTPVTSNVASVHGV